MTKTEERNAKLLKVFLLGVSALLVAIGLVGCDKAPVTTDKKETNTVKKSPNEMPGSTPIPKVEIPAAPSSSIAPLSPEEPASNASK